jgi:hypothetical protein
VAQRELIKALAVALLFSSAVASGCGNSSSQPSTAAALVVGSASGPIFDELASAYRISYGDGTESPEDYAVAIYDGRSLTPEEIQTLPSTDSFLGAGKILIVLEPDVEDLQALRGELGAVPLVETPAAAVFKTYSEDRLLQNATLIEFPTIQSEDPKPAETDDGTEQVASDAVADQRVALDETTLREQTRQWRELFEREHVDAARAMGSDVGAARFDVATASADAPEPAREGLPDWLLAPASIPPAGSSPFWTVRQFTHTKPVTLQITSAVYAPANQGVRRDGSAALQRGLCFFLPDGSSFDLKPPTPSTATVLVTHVVNRMLQETNQNVYNHNVIVRQFVRTSPNVLRPDGGSIGTETVQFCRALAANSVSPFGWYCVEDGFGCNAFKEGFSLQSPLLGFNAQVRSTLEWDPTSAGLLSIASMRPAAANNQTTVATSENWNLNLNFAIQGALQADSVPPGIGISGPGAGGGVDWGWSSAQAINVKDWETRPLGSGATAEHDLFAAGGANNLANLAKFSTTTGEGVLSYTTLTGLQESFLEARTETSWITSGTLLPARTSTLTSQVKLSYGEVYDRFAALNQIDPAPLPFGAIHPFTVTIPIELDFTNPVLQPPLPATWSIDAELSLPANSQGYFPVTGTVTLDETADTDTLIQIGAELYNFGNTQPAPTVVRSMPTRVIVPAGRRSTSFDFLVRRIGSPYNVRLWAYQPTGQQIAYPMTVPAQ